MGLCVGLTGGIGSGKTSVSRLFAELGAGVVDTDEISHELTAPDGAAMAAIRLAFGDQFVTADGALNRAAMRALIFADSTAKAQLEAILHPMIQARALMAIAQSSAPYTVLVVPLLLETGNYQGRAKRVLVVDCDERLQIARTMQRAALTEEQVRAIMASQLPRKVRLAGADDIIVNNGGLDDLCQQVQTLHQAYLALAKS
ncbi:dephospho-CoA kinase [Sulfuriferula plumbiphila]|uniref:Dephospho-CoA kinase n=1 Tax=Sulfuriferula plumbiphila TaxID=171865 RepID=A0A512L4Y7_9PROT|nr:dephospho-CoA kinase [Sulfuriferula plumbiphila]BBP03249.1 dephospho-CoA kinase [Sulfuriferula plumbiphila]GEP29536.1 dephospho-CoA kinase [Sulfuriferula plumbiphila]